PVADRADPVGRVDPVGREVHATTTARDPAVHRPPATDETSPPLPTASAARHPAPRMPFRRTGPARAPRR
ncbi:hypothetical protein, partial [Streptomyces sp. SID10115]|uniref:hypothetical protein n=2 Tax=unclassified Streptomyces TaxID=2593676 RepID=UPI0019D0E579